MFAIGPRDRSSIPSQVIPKPEIMVRQASLLNTQHYMVQINRKWSNPEKGVVPSLTIEKAAFESPFDDGGPTYIYIYIYIFVGVTKLYIYVCVRMIPVVK